MPEKAIAIPNDLVGAAGVHHVASILAMRSLIAMPTIRNTAGVDILVTDPSTGASASLQVKTSQNEVSFWPTSMPHKCLRGKNCYYAFVRYLRKEKRFQVFLEDSEPVVEAITKIVNDQRRKERSIFPCWHLPKDKTHQNALEAKWSSWRPPR